MQRDYICLSTNRCFLVFNSRVCRKSNGMLMPLCLALALPLEPCTRFFSSVWPATCYLHAPIPSDVQYPSSYTSAPCCRCLGRGRAALVLSLLPLGSDTQDALKQLAEHITSNHNLTKLDLKSNCLGMTGCKAIASAISVSVSMAQVLVFVPSLTVPSSHCHVTLVCADRP